MGNFASGMDTITNGAMLDEHEMVLVFVGPSGAGKSTLVNTCYNLGLQTRWHDPKKFPIATEFQQCNVPAYAERCVENHQKKQLGAVTQEPSEYKVVAPGFQLSLIDCPGSCDPRGIEQDNKNTEATAMFLASFKSVNAFCIVIKNSINRSTVEESYGIEQVMSIIPQCTRNRIFLVVTHGDTRNENISDFAYSLNLPLDHIFYFDNFALTRESNIDFNQVDLSMHEDNDAIAAPFVTSEMNPELEYKIAIAQKAKSSWQKSHREFNRILRSAKDLGKGAIVLEMRTIYSLKKNIAEYFIACHRIADAIEQTQLLLAEALLERDEANLAAKWAKDAANTAQGLYQTAINSLETAIFAWRNEGRNFENKKVLQLVIDVRTKDVDRAAEHSMTKNEEEYKKQQEATLKSENYRRIASNVDALQKEKINLQISLIEIFRNLAKVSLTSLCERMVDYYDVPIRKEENLQNKAKLNRHKQIYVELFELYKR